MRFKHRIIGFLVAAAMCAGLTCWSSAAGFNNHYSVVSGGLSHTLIAREGGTVWAWGNNDSGQLGPVNGSKELPTEVRGVTSAVSVAAGSNFSAALLRDGSVSAWGAGDGTVKQVPGIGGVTAISAGQNVLLALKNDGTVWQWTAGSGSSPTKVTGLPGNVAAISAGGGHYLALTRSGDVWAWGRNDKGQLGIGTSDTSDHATPKQVAILHDITDIAAGFSHSLAVDYTGNVYTWGSNNYGQLGDGTTRDSGKPFRISGISDVASVSAGTDFSMALTTAGKIYTWGYGEYGQLGSGSGNVMSQERPALISLVDSGTPLFIASGLYHSMAVTSSGALFAWGRNRDGQVGSGQQTNGLTPQRVFAVANQNYTVGYYETGALNSASGWARGELETLQNSSLIPPSLWANYQSNITRAEFAQLMVSVYEQVKGTTLPVSTSAGFRDIDNHRLADAIRKAYGAELLSGRSATEFAPDAEVTRQEAAKMFCTLIEKMQGITIPTAANRLSYYEDAYDVGTWAEPYVAYAHDHDIMQGSNNRFSPMGKMTREQAMLIVARLAGSYNWR